jgi:hypothetical protein
LFNLALEVIGETSLDIISTILHKSLQILAYADVIVGRYERTIEEAYIKLNKAVQQMGLNID